MKFFWEFIYIVILITITILLPFAIFMYETDEEDEFVIINKYFFINKLNRAKEFVEHFSWNFVV